MIRLCVGAVRLIALMFTGQRQRLAESVSFEGFPVMSKNFKKNVESECHCGKDLTEIVINTHSPDDYLIVNERDGSHWRWSLESKTLQRVNVPYAD